MLGFFSVSILTFDLTTTDVKNLDPDALQSRK